MQMIKNATTVVSVERERERESYTLKKQSVVLLDSLIQLCLLNKEKEINRYVKQDRIL